jgi:hypothetical protein
MGIRGLLVLFSDGGLAFELRCDVGRGHAHACFVAVWATRPRLNDR